MTKISTYAIDTDVTGSDKWIGTDSQNYNLTKNFTPVKLANYFNNSEIISIGTNLRYVYDILEVGEPRKYGTITFNPQQGSSVPFSGITTFILSKFTIGGKDVEDYITKLTGSQIVICNSDNPNSFGVFDITSVTQIILEPNFYTVTLDFIDGYGNLVEDKSYAFQLIRFGQDAPDGVQSVTGNIVNNTDPLNPIVTQVQSDWNASSGLGQILNKPTIPTQTSDLTNDGEDGINPFITAADIPNLTIQQVLNNGNTISDDTFIVYSDNGITSSYYANGEVGFTNTASGDSIAFTSGGILKLASNPLMFTSVGFITPTSNNVINFQNASGTLAFLTDIPAVTGYVPYTGATQNVDLGEYELKAGQIELDQSPTGTAGVAVTRWNNTIGSTETTLKGGSVILKNGVDLVARVVNKVTPNTTLTKAAYQVVRVSGAQGQRLAVAYAQANNDNNSADTLGVVIETIPTNQEGFIMTVGQLEDINTTGSLQGETWADGDVLYLSPTTPGAITKVKPTGATGHIVIIGYVEYAHAIHGKIYVKIMNGWELDELHNVYISSPTNNQVLAYTSSTQLWENKSVSTALGYTPQDTLVSGTNIKTINSTTILGSGNIAVEPVITAGTTAQYFRGDKTFQTLDKTAVGLSNVDNTSDANKPISTATQTALNSKQDSLVSGTNIKRLEGLNLLASGDLEYYNNLWFEQNLGYMIPNVGQTTYTTLRNTNSINQTGAGGDFNIPARILYASSTVIGSFATQRGTQGGIYSLVTAAKFYFKRRFQIDSNISGSRFVCGLSNQFTVAAPTNVEPDTLINTIGVCKLSTSNNLHIFYNDATGLATTVDLGANYPANNITTYFYDLEIYKDNGSSNITIKVTRIDASGNRISTNQVINTNYNTLVNYSPVIYGTNNATIAAFRFFDFGIIFKNYNLQWDTI